MERSEVRALFDSEQCSIARTVDLIGDRWAMLLLREAFYGVSRFEQLRENLGISRAVLTDRLEGLVAGGLLERVPYQPLGQRLRYEYRLTEAGAELIPAFVALLRWGDKHRNRGAGPVEVVHAGCGATLRAELVCNEGHVVPPDDVDPVPGLGIARHPARRRRRADSRV